MDDGLGTGNFLEVNSANDANVRNQPGLNSLVITAFAANSQGTIYEMFVRVYTAESYTDSDHVSFALADVPDKPPTSPTIDYSLSTSSRLLINYPALINSKNGGTPIVSYSLEMDDGNGNNFTDLIGYIKPSMAT